MNRMIINELMNWIAGMTGLAEMTRVTGMTRMTI